MKIYTMWVYATVACILGFSIFKERQALGCPSVPDGSDCNNENGKPLKNTKPYPTDPTYIIFSKIKKAANFSDKWVTWRLSLIVSFIGSLALWFIIFHRKPSGRELITSMLVLTATVYFTISFYKFHLFDIAKNNIDECVNIIEKRIN